MFVRLCLVIAFFQAFVIALKVASLEMREVKVWVSSSKILRYEQAVLTNESKVLIQLTNQMPGNWKSLDPLPVVTATAFGIILAVFSLVIDVTEISGIWIYKKESYKTFLIFIFVSNPIFKIDSGWDIDIKTYICNQVIRVGNRIILN